jgi:uncharacterized membrane protein YfcA
VLEILISYIINFFSVVTVTEFIISASILFIGGSIQGYSGFGGGTVSVPILAILFGPITAVGIITPIYIFGAAAILPNAVRSVDWKEVVPVAVAGSLSVFIGLFFLVDTDPNTVKKVMGSFVLMTTLMMIVGGGYTGPRNVFASILVGLTTGGVTGGTGIPGAPIMVMYYLAAKIAPARQRANILTTGSIFSLCVILGLAQNEIYDHKTTLLILILSPVFVIATRLGQYLFRVAPVNWFKKMAYSLLIFAGLTLLAV